MSLFHKNTLLGASGAGGAEASTYVDDVFSTFLYDGTGSSLSINNGIDLSGEGGAVWLKVRSAATYRHNTLVDSERGEDSSGNFKVLYPNLNDPEYSPGSAANATVSSFNSNGFTAGTNLNTNVSGEEYVSWTFRKAPGFFDIVSWTGDGASGRQIAHNLGSVPGFIMVKSYVAGTGGTGWMCYHRSIGNTKAIRLDNGTAVTSASSTYWNNTSPTSTHFTVGNHEDINGSVSYGRSYVAYVFAHDDQSFGTDEDEAIIKCGKYTGTATSGLEVDLGFEPQFLIMKRAAATSSWYMFDNMRGWGLNDRNYLEANNNYDEGGPGYIVPTSTGFKVIATGFNWNANNEDYIYIAIRRPHRPPTDADDVFDANTTTTTATSTTFTSGFVTDAILYGFRSGTAGPRLQSRLTGNGYLTTSATDSESSTTTEWDNMTGVSISSSSGISLVDYTFKRAPGFFDVVAYTGNGGSQTLSHNLEATPELMLVKERSTTGGWEVYNSNGGNTKFLELNGNTSYSTNQFSWNNTSPTSTQFTVGANNSASGTTYIAYLFATLDGISKVGTYSGTGSDVDVDCGFSAGARFVLIKRTDSTGDWYVWDTARGIATGNDPYLLLNSSAAEVTSTDYVDPLNSGFTVTSSAPAALNASGGTYLFLAIA